MSVLIARYVARKPRFLVFDMVSLCKITLDKLSPLHYNTNVIVSNCGIRFIS